MSPLLGVEPSSITIGLLIRIPTNRTGSDLRSSPFGKTGLEVFHSVAANKLDRPVYHAIESRCACRQFPLITTGVKMRACSKAPFERNQNVQSRLAETRIVRGRPAFTLSLGMVHVAALKSASCHLAKINSDLRTIVSCMNLIARRRVGSVGVRLSAAGRSRGASLLNLLASHSFAISAARSSTSPGLLSARIPRRKELGDRACIGPVLNLMCKPCHPSSRQQSGLGKRFLAHKLLHGRR